MTATSPRFVVARHASPRLIDDARLIVDILYFALYPYLPARATFYAEFHATSCLLERLLLA